MTVTILEGDNRQVLKTLPDRSVNCVVTSPPYFGLRDYGVDGQMGLEATPSEFVDELVALFREVRRVLRDDGTLWLNLGDSYAGGGGFAPNAPSTATSKSGKYESAGAAMKSVGKVSGLKNKDLIGIPWRVAFALQADGWYLRQDIIWHKPNPMPESVTDRCTKAHEYVFLLTKSPQYFYDADAIAEGAIYSGLKGQDESGFKRAADFNGKHAANQEIRNEARPKRGVPPRHSNYESSDQSGLDQVGRRGMRNKRSVWTVATAPFSEAHFATFPPALIEPCILAGCPENCCASCGAPHVADVERVPPDFDGSKYGERVVDASGGALSGGTAKSTLGSGNGKLTGKRSVKGYSPTCSCNAGAVSGVVLDPFGGAGTTGLVADRHQRNAVLIELNPEYAEIARRRLGNDAGMFAEVV